METKPPNPFYNTYVFSEFDTERATIKWWKYPILWFLPTYIQLNDGYIFKYKTFRGQIFIMKCEPWNP